MLKLLLLSISIFLTIACSATVSSRSEVSKQELLADTQYLLSAEPTIDYNDPKLNEILNKYDYMLFKVYKAFIEFDKSDKNQDDIDRAEILKSFFRDITHNNIANDLIDLLPEKSDDYWYQGYKYVKIPLWLVLKYPYIVNYTNGPYTLSVNSKNSIRNLKEFQDFTLHFSRIHEGYLTPMHGSQKINSYLITKHFVNVASFNPAYYVGLHHTNYRNAKNSFKKNMLYAERESYSTIEHRLKYEEFLKSLYRFSAALRQYYKTNYNLSNYIDKADYITSCYVREHTEQLYTPFDTTIVNFLIEAGIDKVNDLKPTIKTLGVGSRSEFLRHAVLANVEIDFIKWLIDNGADVNYKFSSELGYEYPLMASFRNIEVMKLLIAAGADINAVNRVGETALFYAIKFNNLQAVETLIDSGANVNVTTNPKARNIENTSFIRTPLIHARRYASQEIIDLLIKHGAKDATTKSKIIEN